MDIQLKPFSDIDLSDSFFDSLKGDYSEFEAWFQKKQHTENKALVMESETGLEAFLYLKSEEEAILDVDPPLKPLKRLKVGTFKVNPHGTRLGERFIKKIFDYCINYGFKEAYVTIFPKHSYLIQLMKRYGFKEVGVKVTANGEELVLVKDFTTYTGQLLDDFPLFTTDDVNKYLLAIYPRFHTPLFPDSILNNENFNIISDVSYTNSIHKVYVCSMNLGQLKPKDILIIYRTGDGQGAAYYRSVLTSVCIVEEVRRKSTFADFSQFLSYCQPYSIFSDLELREQYDSGNVYVVKMTYNAAFSKRINRAYLLEQIGLNGDVRWGFLKLTDDQSNRILNAGNINESLIINQAGIR